MKFTRDRIVSTEAVVKFTRGWNIIGLGRVKNFVPGICSARGTELQTSVAELFFHAKIFTDGRIIVGEGVVNFTEAQK